MCRTRQAFRRALAAGRQVTVADLTIEVLRHGEVSERVARVATAPVDGIVSTLQAISLRQEASAPGIPEFSEAAKEVIMKAALMCAGRPSHALGVPDVEPLHILLGCVLTDEEPTRTIIARFNLTHDSLLSS